MATTFLLLYSGGRMPEGDEETRQVMGAWEAFLGKYGEAITDAGNPESNLVIQRTFRSAE